MASRYSIIGALVALLVVPAALFALTEDEVNAQISALRAQIVALQTQLAALQRDSATPAEVNTQSVSVRHICKDVLSRVLQEGISGDDVRSLQEFLREEGFFDHDATGYFGALTREALKRWQAAEGVVASGDASTTGWGIVGPRTRAVIAALCRIPASSSQAESSSSESLTSPTTTSTTVPGNSAPTISKFSGPTSLSVSQLGSWTVVATDIDGDTVSYRVTWGDSSVIDAIADIAGISPSTTSPNFSHSYARSGYFEVTLRASDGRGGESRTTALVRVDNPSQAGTTTNYCGLGTYVCPDGKRVTRTGPYCRFECPVSITSEKGEKYCFYNAGYYQENATYIASSCEGDVRNFSEGGTCLPETFICKSGSWLRQFATSCSYNSKTYPEGARHPLGVVGGDLGTTYCVGGEWVEQSQNTSCKFGGTLYPHGGYAPCSGTISSDNTRCIQPEAQWSWPYKNVCQFGKWQLEL